MSDGVKLSKEEIEQAFAQERAERVQICARELEEVLARHNCEVFAVVGVTADGRLAGEVQLRAK